MSRDPAIVSKTMSRIKGRDTGIERKLREKLSEKGFHYLVCSKKAFGHPDILFLKEKVAVFADSEFWHGYNFGVAREKIKSHRDYWITKIEGNIRRDHLVNKTLEEEGYKVMRFWGFEISEDLDAVVDAIALEVGKRRKAIEAARSPKERTTLSYYEKEGKTLLLYRDKKENDLNEGKYVGIGGHIEKGESISAAAKREFKEETGMEVTLQRYRGKVDFVDLSQNPSYAERMYLFRVIGAKGELRECDEGELGYFDTAKLSSLPMWEGDRLFLPLVNGSETFHLLLCYESGRLAFSISLSPKVNPKKKASKRGKQEKRKGKKEEKTS